MIYYQIQLEICQIIGVSGALEKCFDVSAVLDALGLIKSSVLSCIGTDLRPNLIRRNAHVLLQHQEMKLIRASPS